MRTLNLRVALTILSVCFVLALPTAAQNRTGWEAGLLYNLSDLRSIADTTVVGTQSISLQGVCPMGERLGVGAEIFYRSGDYFRSANVWEIGAFLRWRAIEWGRLGLFLDGGGKYIPKSKTVRLGVRPGLDLALTNHLGLIVSAGMAGSSFQKESGWSKVSLGDVSAGIRWAF